MSKEPSYVRCIKPNDSKQAGTKSSLFSVIRLKQAFYCEVQSKEVSDSIETVALGYQRYVYLLYFTHSKQMLKNNLVVQRSD